MTEGGRLPLLSVRQRPPGTLLLPHFTPARRSGIAHPLNLPYSPDSGRTPGGKDGALGIAPVHGPPDPLGEGPWFCYPFSQRHRPDHRAPPSCLEVFFMSTTAPSDPWFQSLFAERIGGAGYGKGSKIYK